MFSFPINLCRSLFHFSTACLLFLSLPETFALSHLLPLLFLPLPLFIFVPISTPIFLCYHLSLFFFLSFLLPTNPYIRLLTNQIIIYLYYILVNFWDLHTIIVLISALRNIKTLETKRSPKLIKLEDTYI